MIICIGKEDLVGSCPYRISNGDCTTDFTADFTIGCSMRAIYYPGSQKTATESDPLPHALDRRGTTDG